MSNTFHSPWNGKQRKMLNANCYECTEREYGNRISVCSIKLRCNVWLIFAWKKNTIPSNECKIMNESTQFHRITFAMQKCNVRVNNKKWMNFRCEQNQSKSTDQIIQWITVKPKLPMIVASNWFYVLPTRGPQHLLERTN